MASFVRQNFILFVNAYSWYPIQSIANVSNVALMSLGCRSNVALMSDKAK